MLAAVVGPVAAPDAARVAAAPVVTPAAAAVAAVVATGAHGARGALRTINPCSLKRSHSQKAPLAFLCNCSCIVSRLQSRMFAVPMAQIK